MRFIVGWLFGAVLLWGFLLAAILVFNAPLLVAARLAQKRLRPLVPRLTLALGFAFAAAYMLWKMDWFDVWRHGVPPVGFILTTYSPWIILFASVGWLAGGLVVRERRAARG